MKKIILTLVPSILIALESPLVAQNFTAPGSLNEFSDAMVEQPNTAMTIEPNEPSDAYTDESVIPDASYTPPQEPYFPDLPETANTYEGPVGVTGIFNGNVTTGCSYDPLGHSSHRAADDIVVPGSVGKYPLKMTRYYNSRLQYYAAPGAIGLSPGWSHEYAWLLWGDGYRVVSPHGNVSDFFCGPPLGVSDCWDDGIQGQHPNGGTWRLADGGKVVFSGGHATNIYDPSATGRGLRTTRAGRRLGSASR
jgi:hypothetical protein